MEKVIVSVVAAVVIAGGIIGLGAVGFWLAMRAAEAHDFAGVEKGEGHE